MKIKSHKLYSALLIVPPIKYDLYIGGNCNFVLQISQLIWTQHWPKLMASPINTKYQLQRVPCYIARNTQINHMKICWLSVCLSKLNVESRTSCRMTEHLWGNWTGTLLPLSQFIIVVSYVCSSTWICKYLLANLINSLWQNSLSFHLDVVGQFAYLIQPQFAE